MSTTNRILLAFENKTVIFFFEMFFRINKNGFSLIEIMIVVALVATLAVIGVPEYSKFKAKAKRVEAKLSLSHIYTTLKGFHMEYNGYVSNMKILGFNHSGRVLYNLQFIMPCTTWANCAPNFGSTSASPYQFDSSEKICNVIDIATSPSFAESGCQMIGSGDIITRGGKIGYRDVGRTYVGLDETTSTRFAVSASAQIIDGAFINTEVWRINQNKTITLDVDGLSPCCVSRALPID